jgi:hypothetical protein
VDGRPWSRLAIPGVAVTSLALAASGAGPSAGGLLGIETAPAACVARVGGRQFTVYAPASWPGAVFLRRDRALDPDMFVISPPELRAVDPTCAAFQGKLVVAFAGSYATQRHILSVLIYDVDPPVAVPESRPLAALPPLCPPLCYFGAYAWPPYSLPILSAAGAHPQLVADGDELTVIWTEGDRQLKASYQEAQGWTPVSPATPQ